MDIAVRARHVAGALLLAVAMVAGIGSLQGANAASLAASSSVDTTVGAFRDIVNSPSYLAAERAVLAGQPIPADAKRVLEVEVSDVLGSAAFQASARELAPLTANLAVGERGIPEFMYHFNQGNQRMLAAVNVFTALVVPMVLACRVGDPLCIVAWIHVGAGLAAGAVVSGAFSYVQAVLALP